jgi:cellulose synthase (UDP-forming)
MALVTAASLTIYWTVRVALVTTADYAGPDLPVTIALLLAESFLLFHALGYLLSVIRSLRGRPAVAAAVLARPEDFPEVDVLVAARHEPREVLERTLTALVGMAYPAKTIWLLDDSSDPKYVEEAASLARQFGVKLFRREPRHGAKAGIINDCLKKLTGKYVAMLDADQCPMSFFLNRIVPLLEADPKLAFVQTPQFYSNFGENRVARAAGSQQAVFYEYICEAKAMSGTAFCCGTNVVFRREALVSVGGLDETSVTEDFATSVKLHLAGWKSLYYGETYVMGMGPETLSAYFRQQYRWARGTLGVGLHLLKRLVTAPHTLSFWQWIDYGLSGTYYFVGWSYLILMACPLFYIAFGIPSYFVRPEIYAAAFLPYLAFAIMVFVGGLERRHYSLGQIIQGQLLGLLAAPVYVMASLAVIFGIKSSFGITPKGAGGHLPLRACWSQIAICAASFSIFIWGACRCVFERDLAAGINAFWAGVHFAAFWSVFYFMEAEPQEAPSDQPTEMGLQMVPA